MDIKNISIRTKILVIPVLAIVGFLLYLAYTSNINQSNSKRLDAVVSIYLPQVENVNAIIFNVQRLEDSFHTAVITADSESLSDADDIKDKITSSIEKLIQVDKTNSGSLTQLDQDFTEYYTLARNLTGTIIEGGVDFSLIQKDIEKKNNLRETIEKSTEKYRAVSIRDLNAAINKATSLSERAVYVGILVCLAILIIVGFISFSIAYLVSNGMNVVVDSLKEISEGQGDIGRRLDVKGNDEIGQVAKWFNVFVGKIHIAILDVVNVCTPLSNMSNSLYTVSEQMDQSTKNLMQVSGELSRSMTEMSTVVDEVAKYAGEAAVAAGDADHETKQGLLVVENTISSIERLSDDINLTGTQLSQLEEYTENVGNIVGVIRSIAEQTNLLALNAAIEAARAGDQGRGFAVVADEVRTLASRTQVSTEEIQTVIEQLQAGAKSAVSAMGQSRSIAEESVQEIAKTGETLAQINLKVSSILDQNNLIAAATEEQNTTSKVIMESMGSLENAANTSSVSTDEVVKLTSRVRECSDQLAGVCKQFNI